MFSLGAPVIYAFQFICQVHSLFIQNNSFKNFTLHLSTDSFYMMKPAGKRQEQALEEKVRYPIKSNDKKELCEILACPQPTFFFFVLCWSLRSINPPRRVFVWYAWISTWSLTRK